MPIYKLVSNLNERLSHNGRFYNFGDVVMERIVVTEEEAAIMNRNQTGTILVLLDKDQKVQEQVQEVVPEREEVKPKKSLEQMNKEELKEVGKGLGLELEGTNKEMVLKIKEKQAELTKTE